MSVTPVSLFSRCVRSRFGVGALLALGALSSLPLAQAAERTLTVYTYDSFASDGAQARRSKKPLRPSAVIVS